MPNLLGHRSNCDTNMIQISQVNLSFILLQLTLSFFQFSQPLSNTGECFQGIVTLHEPCLRLFPLPRETLTGSHLDVNQTVSSKKMFLRRMLTTLIFVLT